MFKFTTLKHNLICSLFLTQSCMNSEIFEYKCTVQLDMITSCFHCMEKSKYSPNYLLLCSTEESQSLRFCWRVNDDRIVLVELHKLLLNQQPTMWHNIIVTSCHLSFIFFLWMLRWKLPLQRKTPSSVSITYKRRHLPKADFKVTRMSLRRGRLHLNDFDRVSFHLSAAC